MQAQGGTCRFSSDGEGVATVRAWLRHVAPACDIARARYMGGNAEGGFYEVGCAGGAGYVARLDVARTVQELLPCAEAAGVGGGCLWPEERPLP